MHIKGKGIFYSKAGGGKGKMVKFFHGSRHRKAQMKFFSGPRFKAQVANNSWRFANSQALAHQGRGLFGLN